MSLQMLFAGVVFMAGVVFGMVVLAVALVLCSL